MKKLINNQIISYLFFGGLATLVYLSVRTSLFNLLNVTALHASVVANLTAILFAFVTNDRFVFRQNRQGWQTRFAKFVTARLGTLALDMALAYLFIDRYPGIIGQFVNQDLELINVIESISAQILIIVGNYFLSKFLIFTNKSS